MLRNMYHNRIIQAYIWIDSLNHSSHFLLENNFLWKPFRPTDVFLCSLAKRWFDIVIETLNGIDVFWERSSVCNYNWEFLCCSVKLTALLTALLPALSPVFRPALSLTRSENASLPVMSMWRAPGSNWFRVRLTRSGPPSTTLIQRNLVRRDVISKLNSET